MTTSRGSKLLRCPRCGGFVPPARIACVHCARGIPSWARRAALLLGGTAAAMTLSACYGGGCYDEGCYETYPQPTVDETQPCPEGELDLDGDGVCSGADCDDRDDAVAGCGSGS
ncbi:MAG: hypothetical protein AB7S26_17640 [Sandaracinaceae bacterium]